MGGPCRVDGQLRQELDNFYPCKFELDGKVWVNVEQYFQAAKFYDEGYRELIRAEPSGTNCWRLGNSREFPIRSDWEAVKVDVMYRANLAKFQQNPNLKEVLVSSRGPIEAFGFPFWKKWNAILLERIREELRIQSDQNEAVLEQRISDMVAYKSATS